MINAFHNEAGVTFPQGFKAAGVKAGIKKSGNLDVAVIYTEKEAAVAGTFTQNAVAAAPVFASKAVVATGTAHAIVANAGCANACTGEQGEKDAKATQEIAAEALGCTPQDVVVASTGVIGVPLPMDKLEVGVKDAISKLSADGGSAASQAIMTTDTHPKTAALEIELGGKKVRFGVIAKGSGMIQPNMATMLCVMSTDAALTEEAAHEALLAAVKQTFNKVTVDSDTSTNDTAVLLATGKAAPAGERIGLDSPAYPALAAGIKAVCGELARKIAADGEGSTKLVTVNVLGAANDTDADTVARSIANSPLVKTAIFGHDANWGRVAAAAGKCGVAFDQSRVDIDFMGVPVCRAGLTVPMDEDDMLRRFEAPEIDIAVDLHDGDASCRIWTCDLTHDYVTINGDYRT